MYRTRVTRSSIAAFLSVLMLGALASPTGAEPGPTPGPSAIISHFAGAGENGPQGWSGDGGPAVEATFNGPFGIAVDDDGQVFFSTRNGFIWMVDDAGIATRFAGFGPGFSGDGGLATNAEIEPNVGLAFSPNGDLYLSGGARIRRIDSSGIITTVAGTGTFGSSGDGGLALDADIVSGSIAFDSDGNLFVTGLRKVRKVSPAGTITTIAGTGALGNSGDGGQATEAEFDQIADIDVAPNGDLYILDVGALVVRKVDDAGVITTVAGSGDAGWTGDGGPALEATFGEPWGIAVDEASNIYIGENANVRIRRIDAATGVIDTLAGSGAFGEAGDGGPAIEAEMPEVSRMAIGPDGSLYFPTGFLNTVRVIRSDEIAPAIEVDATPQAVPRFGAAEPFEFLCADDVMVATCVATIDGVAITSGSPIPTSSLGGATVVVTSTDTAGNVTSERFSFAVDWAVRGEYAAASGIAGTVVRFYIATFGRLPDAGGFSYWEDRLAANPDDLPAVADFFTGSPEFEALYGETVTDTEFIDTIYRNVLGRPPEAAGRMFWASEIETGARTRAQVMEFFAQSAEHKEITATS